MVPQAIKEENTQQEVLAASLRTDLKQLRATVSFIALLFAYPEVIVINFFG